MQNPIVEARLNYDKRFQFTSFALIKSFMTARKKIHRFKKVNNTDIPHIQIQTINKCNAHCKICPYKDSKEAKNKTKYMSNKLFLKIVDELANLKYAPTLELTLQNEPLMDKGIFKKITTLKKRLSNKVSIITNGSLLTKKKVDELKNSNLDDLYISLHASNKKSYEELENGLDYDKILKNLEYLKDNKGNTRLHVIFLRYGNNQNELNNFVDYWKREGFIVNIWDILNRAGGLKEYDNLKPKNVPIKNKIYKYIKNSQPYCSWLFQTMCIKHNGEVILCCCDYSHDTILGNVKKNSLQEIRNGKLYNYYRSMILNNKKHKLPTCKECVL